MPNQNYRCVTNIGWHLEMQMKARILKVLKHVVRLLVVAGCCLIVFTFAVDVTTNATITVLVANQLLDEDVHVNLRTARPYITQCLNKDGAWMWQGDGNGLYGVCVFPDQYEGEEQMHIGEPQIKEESI